ncbi:MAG TPA: sulfatase-like hydrolase/transferase [Thermoanaerobaculia bacterium]|nr:sulfatase-like hydrolase/transferase [Thermoanaerobaculia bacterium]
MAIFRKAFVSCVLLLAACGDRVPRPSNETPVFLISIDTLRSDRLPAYGYRGVATPAIDRLRADGILFEHAYSHCPLTLPSHATILTGRLPADTGIRDNVGYQLDPNVPTLAELLGKNGYRTGAAVSSFVLRKNTRIDRGFSFWDDQVEQGSSATAIGEIQRPGPKTAEVAKRWIAEHGGNPLFFLLHLYEPHTPYEPPEPFRSRYPNPYDGEIAAADQIVEEFLAFLEQQDLYDRSLIILFSDHGEGLGDHGEDEHGIFLYREAIQVPLIVKLPKSAMRGRSVATAVQLSDIFPTVTEVTGTRTGVVDGKSLLSFLKGEPRQRLVYSETYYPRFHFGWSDLHSLTDGQKHLIQAPRPELFALATDPGEKHNVLQQDRRAYTAMRNALQPLIREAAAPSAIDSEEAAKLAALGYLGAGAQTAPGAELPDPKDSIGVLADVRHAFTLARRDETDTALALTEKLLAANPAMLDLWDLKARLLATQRRQREAIEAAKEGLRLAPTASHLALLIATIALEIGDTKEAEQHAELAMRIEPARAHDLLARVWIERGDLARAESEARKSLASQKDRALAFVTLARVQKERGNYGDALGSLDAAAASLAERGSRTINGLHFLRGDALARLGRIGEAEQAFREEIRLFPQESRAYKNLILLYVADGRTQEATRLIHELVEKSPTPLGYFAVIDVLKTVGDERGVKFWARRAQQRFPNDRRFAALS